MKELYAIPEISYLIERAEKETVVSMERNVVEYIKELKREMKEAMDNSNKWLKISGEINTILAELSEKPLEEANKIAIEHEKIRR